MAKQTIEQTPKQKQIGPSKAKSVLNTEKERGKRKRETCQDREGSFEGGREKSRGC